MNKQLLTQENKIEQIRRSAQSVLDLYDELVDINDSRRDQIAMSLFRAVAVLTLERAQPGIQPQDIRFSPKDLFEKAVEIGATKISIKEAPSEWVRKNWKKLEQEIAERRGHLQDLSQRKGLEYFPWIDKEKSEGGKGNYSYYYLVAKPFNETEKIESKCYDLPEGGLHFVPELLSDFPIWARWVNGFVLKGWQKYAFLLPVLLAMLFGLFLFYALLTLGINSNISTVSWLSYWVIAGGLIAAVLSSPLYRVVHCRIVMAPTWMIPIKERSVQLELKRIDTDPETGNAIRELRFMVYSAKCPICSGRVEVEGGGIEFPFRLIGRCCESPREHIFSFDHVTRTGKPLRSN